MPHDPDFELPSELFAAIRRRFADLVSRSQILPSGALEIAFPQQDDLAFPITANSENDEFTLVVGDSHHHYSPINDHTANELMHMIAGLIEGNCRVVEHWRGNVLTKATLQFHYEGKWIMQQFMAAPFHVSWFKKKRVVILHNKLSKNLN